ncbi:GNAT family N-acetyltransferase [Planococcus sp. CP5-4]|uniref:GNAT family N-acetyltransferase n=1 Tax=unclassified Planococcus (in: firmicutes) TaxID=2662419 RepID=UPI001C250FA7|nr:MULTISPECIES: GNAT family N-acetyltransferase [unclassified Planococcus (in: firmicutes)]MBU9672351.1 GNAT family N-acetyltransferase [Planococcus sp. CP5-4_YE]MBV0909402.1 GNAT family N-acetyltransferase [Planococcus sp. CP5-4_UN]MBW6064131.1 GNAT family N-acetyltransferase [Planococcus sp. CP5-4]
MEWKWYKEIGEYVEKARPLLEKREDLYSLFLGVLGQIEQGRYETFFLGLAEDAQGIAALALMTPPHPLQLIVLRESVNVEVLAANEFRDAKIEISGVIGDKRTAERFTEAWGGFAEIAMDQGLYRIDAVQKKLPKSPGTWRVANRLDAALLADWYQLFGEDTGTGNPSQEEAEEKIADFISRKEVFLWEDGGRVVSCMKKARPSKHGVTVSFVFTPKELRKKGYARTLVAEITEELLNEYDFAMLYTDLANGTSNKIYQEIGYEQIANPVHLKFGQPERE